MNRRLLLYGGLLVLLVVIGIGPGLMLREYHHQQASHTLIMAIKANNIPTALAALKAGADPNATHDDIDPLGWAAHHGFTQVVRLLLQHGADPRIKGIYGYTALADAAMYITDESTSNKRECVSLILNAGADVNARADDGDTTLTVACLNVEDENVEVVRLLLQHHADPNFQNSYGMTALDYTLERDNPQILKLLRQAGAKTTKELAVQSKPAVGQPQSSQASLTTADTVRVSVYQYQIAHFGHDYRLSNNLYFVGISANPLLDPSPAVIQSLQSTHYRLKGVSQSIENTGGPFGKGGVSDRKTKEIGLAFFVTKVRFLSPTKAKVKGDVFFNGKGGHDDIYVVELINGGWKVTKCDIQGVS